MSRIFLSHASRDYREAVALKLWLSDQRPDLANEIFLDIDPETGLALGGQWSQQLVTSNARCEYLICLLSKDWLASMECRVEFRTAEGFGKRIIAARLQDTGDQDPTSHWQRCDLFAGGDQVEIAVPDGPPVRFNAAALDQIKRAIEGGGIGPESFVWPPNREKTRAPYRGWDPFEDVDAGVFFGRDAAIARGLDALRSMRYRLVAQLSGRKSLFVVLGPSGSGKSSFLRAGLIPRLQRDNQRFEVMGVMRPDVNALTGDYGLAAAIYTARCNLGLRDPALGEIKSACADDPDRIYELLAQLRNTAKARLPFAETGDEPAVPGDDGSEQSAPTLVLPLDQAEELFSADAGEQAEQFLTLIADVLGRMNAVEVGLVVAATIRTDRYEVMQNHPALAGVDSLLFDELKPMPDTEFREVITGPAKRSTEGGHQLRIAEDLVQRLLADAAEGADALPLLALTLARLYQDYASTGELTLSHYEAVGGIRKVVETAVNEVLSTDATERARQLTVLRAAFIPWLATINPDNDQPMRRVAREADLPADSRPLIDALVDKRLLVRDERDGQTVVEVALESLLRQWDELAGWLKAEAQNLKTVDDIDRNATAWEMHGHDPAWLMTGTRLADAETLSGAKEFRNRLITARGYLAASRAAENQRIKAEQEQRQKELRHARELARLAQQQQQEAEQRQRTAEALAYSETQARYQAQEHASVLRKRSRTLRAVLAGTVVIAILALVGAIVAAVFYKQSQTRFHEATALRLANDATGILAGDRPGHDIQAFQELLAAQAINPKYGPAILDAQARRFSTDKIINAGAPLEFSALSSDGKFIAVTDANQKARIYDADSGRPVGDPVDGVNGIAFSPDGKLFATAAPDRGVLVYGVDGRDLQRTLEGPSRVVARVAFSHDGHIVAAGSTDGTVWLWDPDSGKAIRTLRPDSRQPVYAVAFSPDGTRLATGGPDGKILIWETATGQLKQSITESYGAVAGLAFSSDGSVLASAEHDRAIELWDPATGKSLHDPLITQDAVMDVAFDPQSGQRLASAGSSGTVHLWSFVRGVATDSALPGRVGQVQAVAFSSNGQRLAAASKDGLIRVWNPDRGQPMVASIGEINGVAFSHDGKRVGAAGEGGFLQIWDTDTGQRHGDAMPGGSRLLAVDFSPTEPEVAAVGDDDGNVQLWNTADAKLIRKLPEHRGSVDTVQFSGDGNLIASGGEEGDVVVFDSQTGRSQVLSGHTERVESVVFSRDGRRVVSAGTDGNVFVWDLSTGQHDVTVHLKEFANSVAISPDGRHLAVGVSDGTVRRYSAETGDSEGAPMTGHSNIVRGVAYSPDGRLIVSASYDETVRLWDANTGAPVGSPMTGHTNSLSGLSISSDGRFIATGSLDRTVRLWPLTASASDLCNKLAANMSKKQWREWVSAEIDYRVQCPGLPVPND